MGRKKKNKYSLDRSSFTSSSLSPNLLI